MKKTQIIMNKPIYLALTILDLIKIAMSEFSSDYIKQKYSEKAKLCYMDTDSFIICLKTRLMKDELGRHLMKKFIGLSPKIYSYLKDNNGEDKKEKDTKKCFIKRELTFKDYKKCLKGSWFLIIINYLERKEINVDYLNKDKK